MTPRPRTARPWDPAGKLFGGALRCAGLLAPAILLAGCGHSAPTRFYSLAPEGPVRPLGLVAEADPVRVLAVRAPPELDRLEVARGGEGGGVQGDDLDR